MELFSRDGGGVEVTLEMKKRVVAGDSGDASFVFELGTFVRAVLFEVYCPFRCGKYVINLLSLWHRYCPECYKDYLG
jgi:hypothetical protein